jgi:mono/diheme cytochrome c family protein
MMSMRLTAALIAAAGLIGLLSGCNKGSDAQSSNTPPQGMGPMSGPVRVEEKEPFLAGKKVFNANCSRCHSTVQPGGGRAPNLAHVGAENNVAWLTEFIRDPRSKHPETKMPSFANLSEDDVKAVAEFLASLK